MHYSTYFSLDKGVIEQFVYIKYYTKTQETIVIHYNYRKYLATGTFFGFIRVYSLRYNIVFKHYVFIKVSHKADELFCNSSNP